MSNDSKSRGASKEPPLNTLFVITLTGILFISLLFVRASQGAETDLISRHEEVSESDFFSGEEMIIFQENTLSPSFAIYKKKTVALAATYDYQVVDVIYTTITAYSSTVDQTNSEPFITASGEWVRDGIVAANFLPFGTKIRIPKYFGDKVFVVKDRMNARYQNRVDIWTTSRQNALNFGIKYTHIEVVR